MTSKRSLWVNQIENHKRRIVIWILAILGNLLVYPVFVLMYYTRIKEKYERGAYKTVEYFRQQMKQATCDALCFEQLAVGMACILAVAIIMQGFSYLYSRQKQDLYLSVPVSMKDRFKIIYINGVLIYALTSAVSLLLASGLAVFEGAVDMNLFGRMWLSYLFTLLFFLCFYNLTLLALLLTGNIFMTAVGTVVLLIYASTVRVFLNGYVSTFFEKYTNYFEKSKISLFLPDLYITGAQAVASIKPVGEAFIRLLPNMGGMLLFVAVTLILAYALYRKRPSEAAGKAIAFQVLKPFLKIAMIIPVALVIGIFAYELTEENVPSLVAAMAVGGILFGMAVEVVYEADIRAALHHFALTVVGTCVALIIFGAIKWDVFGYDSYVPKPEEIASYAVLDTGMISGSDHWTISTDKELPDTDGNMYDPAGLPYISAKYVNFITNDYYVEEHMFLTDTEAICALAEKTARIKEDDLTEKHGVSVLYRLKNGREVARMVWFDLADESSVPFLNRIYGAPEYVDGCYQAAHLEEVLPDEPVRITYSNGIWSIDTQQVHGAKDMADAWVRDMKKTDYTYFRNHMPIGEVRISFRSYRSIALPVYEDFVKTIACLEQNEIFLTEKLQADDVVKILVTHYDRDEFDYEVMGNGGYPAAEEFNHKVQKEYKDKEQISAILEGAYCASFSSPFAVERLYEDDYSLEVYLDVGGELSTENGFTRYFCFLSGKVPDFVKKDMEQK